jgi:hypothetical protein
MRLFKVYDAAESDHELVFARNHRQAASIAKTVWEENGYRCRRFKVVELCLPSSIEEGREPVGLVYEPATTPKESACRSVRNSPVPTRSEEEMKQGCKGCGSTCGMPSCSICKGKTLCSKCKWKGKVRK